MGKVGRPKLADKKLLKESIIVVAVVLLLVSITSFYGFKILSLYVQKPNLTANVVNVNPNSCVFSNKIITCGKNVNYMMYSVDNKKYQEIYKQKANIRVKTNSNTVTVFYKNNSNKLIKLK